VSDETASSVLGSIFSSDLLSASLSDLLDPSPQLRAQAANATNNSLFIGITLSLTLLHIMPWLKNLDALLLTVYGNLRQRELREVELNF
jgi:hypothetical protein